MLVFLLPLVGLALSSAQTISSDQKIGSNFFYEESCNEARGYCVLEKECHHPVDKNHRTLCPMQKEGGAVCCKDFPMSDVNCFQLHNACMESNCTLNLGKRGCPGNQLCCILL